jgi:hypothetical protein
MKISGLRLHHRPTKEMDLEEGNRELGRRKSGLLDIR